MKHQIDRAERVEQRRELERVKTRIGKGRTSFSWSYRDSSKRSLENNVISELERVEQASHGLTETRQKGHWKIMSYQGGEREKYTHFR
jgi:hypothetical protein